METRPDEGGAYPAEEGPPTRPPVDPAPLFRREAGRLVSLLTRILGTENLEIAEDAVQETLLQALEAWKSGAMPDNAPAWLFRVARNKAIDVLRRNRHTVRYDPQDDDHLLLRSEYTLAVTLETRWDSSSIEDDMLGMMFACCHPGIPEESQIALVLKTLCGLSTTEIAQAFLASEDTVSKRLFRAKEFFRRERIRPGIPNDGELRDRLGPVLHSIYLIFNEGYLSTRGHPVRGELMDEAMALGKLIVDNPHTAEPRACALMALMCFHAARTGSRLDPEGSLVLLQDQDRSSWDARLIGEGCDWLNRGAAGEAVTAYHLEAAIAFEHCRAPSFAATDWVRILQYYDWLCRIASGPMALLNRAIAVLQVSGPAAALEEVGRLDLPAGPPAGTLRHALLGEIHARLGDAEEARAAFTRAASLTRSDAERKSLLDRAERV